MPQSFYSDDDAEAILKLASRKSGNGPVSRERLVEMAAELGISPAAVEEAELSFRRDKQISDDFAAWRKHKRSEFTAHFMSYLGTCGGLTILDLFTSHGHLTWAYWVIFGWGIGVVGSFRDCFLLRGEEQEKAFQKWRRKRDRRALIADNSGMEVERTEGNRVGGLKIKIEGGKEPVHISLGE